MAGLHGLFDIGSSPGTVASPAASHQQNLATTRQKPSNIELDEFAFGKCYNGPADPASTKSKDLASGTQTPMETIMPQTPNELEQSRPSTPRQDDAVGLVQRWNDPPINKWRVLSCCLMYLGTGINDSGMYIYLHLARVYPPYIRVHQYGGYLKTYSIVLATDILQRLVH